MVLLWFSLLYLQKKQKKNLESKKCISLMPVRRKAYLKITLISKAKIDHGHVYDMKLVNVHSIPMPHTIKKWTFFFKYEI